MAGSTPPAAESISTSRRPASRTGRAGCREWTTAARAATWSHRRRRTPTDSGVGSICRRRSSPGAGTPTAAGEDEMRRDFNDWSDFIDEATATPQQPPLTFNGAPPLNGALNGAGRSYALAGLRNECDILAATPEGSRNDRLNIAAYSVAGFIPQTLSEEEVVAALSAAAAQAGL